MMMYPVLYYNCDCKSDGLKEVRINFQYNNYRKRNPLARVPFSFIRWVNHKAYFTLHFALIIK